MEFTKHTVSLRALLAAPLLLVQDVAAFQPTPPPLTVQRIRVEIFDKPLREASLSLLSLLSEGKGSANFVDQAVLQTQNLYLQASRFRHAYGERGWQKGGDIVEGLLTASLKALQEHNASPAFQSTVAGYRDTLTTASPTGRRSR